MFNVPPDTTYGHFKDDFFRLHNATNSVEAKWSVEIERYA